MSKCLCLLSSFWRYIIYTPLVRNLPNRINVIFLFMKKKKRNRIVIFYLNVYCNIERWSFHVHTRDLSVCKYDPFVIHFQIWMDSNLLFTEVVSRLRNYQCTLWFTFNLVKKETGKTRRSNQWNKLNNSFPYFFLLIHPPLLHQDHK